MENDNWDSWQNHVLKELERFDQELKIIHKDNRQILVAIATLKAQSAIWGAISGVIFASLVSMFLK